MDSDKRDKDASVLYTESTPVQKKGFLAHLKRFWWAYLLAIVLIVVLVVLLIIFVGVKAIAQKKLNNAALSIQGITVTNTTSDEFTMSINSTIKSDSTKATVESFNATMYLEDEADHTPFATILFPETENQPEQTVNVTQSVPIENMDALTTFNTWLLANDSLRVTVYGKTHIKVHGISRRYPVTFKKIITMPGLSGFAGISVSDINVTSSTFSDGSNFHATVTIPNKSLVAFEIGNTTFNTYVNESSIGTSYIDNVYLNQGDNVFAYRALVNSLTILTTVSEEPYCTNVSLPIEISGKSVENNGESLSYFADALASVNDTISVALGEPLSAIGFNISCSS